MNLLPQELVEEILSHLPLGDSLSLRNCSLVSKSWMESSRRLLFANLCLRPDTHQSWLDTISPTNTTLLRNVRSLEYSSNIYGISDPRYSIHALREYLPSFCQLRRLEFLHMDIEPSISKQLELFSAFQHTLLSLSLTSVSISWSSFVALVGHFPCLRDLVIFGTWFEADDIPVPNVLYAGRGRLSVEIGARVDVGVLCDRFGELKPEYNQLDIIGTYDHRLVAAVEENLESLAVTLCDSKQSPGLSRCPNLRQLSFSTVPPRAQERALISSITSTNFRRLIFITKYLLWEPHLSHRCWITFDDMICELVGRLQKSGYQHILEVEFQAEFVELHEDADRFLPKFKKKGRVRITKVSNGGYSGWP